MRRSSLLFPALALALLVASGAVRADVFKLKDGSTIVGTVVGYSGNAFKVRTSYGYALVEKDKIVSIQLANAPESSASEKKAKPEPRKVSSNSGGAAQSSTGVAAKPAPNSAKRDVSGTAVPTASASIGQAESSGTAPGAPAGQPSPPEGSPGASQGNMAAPVGVPVPNPQAASIPQPEPIREKVTGNTYVNETYQFQMYKPPDWQVMDSARSVLPGAIAAMGTDDQSTYLVVGQQTAGKSAVADDASMVKQLSTILANFRPLPDETLSVAGATLTAHRFRGGIDEHDWSGFLVSLRHGAKLYTIFGMTQADNDLVQIQENVIRRVISSFQFLPQ